MKKYTLEEAKGLLNNNKLREAGTAFDMLLTNKKNQPDIWYLRGLVSLKLKNYTYAHECFTYAVELEKKAEYYKINGMAYMEQYDLEAALEAFEEGLAIEKKDPELYFYSALSCLFLNDTRAQNFLERAYALDRKKMKNMVKNFFDVFFKDDHLLDEKTKEEIKKKLEKL